MNTANAKKTESNNHNGMPFLEFANQAMKQYEQALRAGIKMQGEMAERWNKSFSQPACAQDWQKPFAQFVTMANEAMPLAQKRMEEAVEFMEKNTRTNAELVKKAMDAAQTPVIADSQAKWMDFWSSSLGAAQANTEALTQFNAKAIDSCLDFFRKNTEVTQIRVPKSA